MERERAERELLDRMARLPVIDTHEHMTMEADFVRGRYDFADLMSYVGLDLGLAGLPASSWGGAQTAVREGKSVEEKWRRLKPFWPAVRTGAYGRAYRRTLRIFFGMDDLDDEAVRVVSGGIADYQRAGVYDEWLHGRYGIRVMLQAGGPAPLPEPEHFAAVYCIDGLIAPFTPGAAEREVGAPLPAAAADYVDLLRAKIRAAADSGTAGLKIGFAARCRLLDFLPHADEAVQESYDFLRAGGGDWQDAATRLRLKPFQDAAAWAAFGVAGELGLPVQVHSGLAFMQPWDGRPSGLIPSLVRFPGTRFAIFHGSYPYMAELTGLAKSFANVYLDLAWFHLLSRHETRRWLAEWLDVLPHNKLFAFGGDVFLFFGICSHLELARENVAAVLADRVADGLCDLDEAEQTARLLFHDNARRTFQFGD
jgi:predicted TIM-barrel fold metal-dependent hydrolase